MNNETLVYFIKDSLDGFKLLCGYFFDLVYIGSCGVIGAFLASFGPILYFVLVDKTVSVVNTMLYIVIFLGFLFGLYYSFDRVFSYSMKLRAERQRSAGMELRS